MRQIHDLSTCRGRLYSSVKPARLNNTQPVSFSPLRVTQVHSGLYNVSVFASGVLLARLVLSIVYCLLSTDLSSFPFRLFVARCLPLQIVFPFSRSFVSVLVLALLVFFWSAMSIVWRWLSLPTERPPALLAIFL